MIKYKGKSLRQHALAAGISPATVVRRYREGIRGPALTAKTGRGGPRADRYEYNGSMMTVSEIAKLEGINYMQAYRKVRGKGPGLRKPKNDDKPIPGLFTGCSQEQIKAMLTGDFKAFMKAS